MAEPRKKPVPYVLSYFKDRAERLDGRISNLAKQELMVAARLWEYKTQPAGKVRAGCCNKHARGNANYAASVQQLERNQ